MNRLKLLSHDWDLYTTTTDGRHDELPNSQTNSENLVRVYDDLVKAQDELRVEMRGRPGSLTTANGSWSLSEEENNTRNWANPSLSIWLTS